MEIVKFIKDYWIQIVFLCGVISTLIVQIKTSREATRCSLRNDILEIWDKCKDTKTITKFQLDSYIDSRDLYYKLNGDGFIHTLDTQIMTFKIID